MKTENIDNLFKELVIVGIIFMSICFGLQSLQHNQELKRVHKLIEDEKQAKIEVMKVAININNSLSIALSNLNSVNEYASSLEVEIDRYKEVHKLTKDLDRSR